jgi:cytochrome P450
MKEVDTATRSIFDLKTKVDVADLYKEIRAERPLYFDKEAGMYVVSRYDDAMKVLGQPNLYSVALALFHSYRFEDTVTKILETEAHGAFVDVLPMTDPPVHTRVRAMVNLAFSAPRIAKIQNYIKDVTAELIGSFIDDGKAEIVSQLAVPMPVAVIAHMLSVPHKHAADIKRWTRAYSACSGNLLRSEEEARQAGRDLAEMQNFIVARLDEYRVNPGDNLLTELLNARVGNYEPFTDKEILAVVAAFLGAGHETVTAAVTSAMKLLATHPEVVDMLHCTSDKDAAYRLLIEEVLRLDPPVNGLPRVATEDSEINGVKIPKGSPLLIVNASANRDETIFGDTAEAFDPARASAKRHLTFGGGIHICLGSVLARAELRHVLQTLIEQIRNLRLAKANLELSDYTPLIMAWNLKLKKLDVIFERRA